MSQEGIKRVNYRNEKKDLDFEVVDIQLFYSTRPKKLLEKAYRVNFWTILYITEGAGVHYVDFKAYPYKKGDILFVQKNQVHEYRVNRSVEGYVIHINEPFFYRVEGFDGDIFLEYVDRAYGSPLLHFDTSPGLTNRSLMDMIYQEYNKKSQALQVELIASLFQSFILSLRGQVQGNRQELKSRDYDHFKNFRRLVEDRYMETRNVEDYGQMMNLSTKTINQVTRRITGLSAKQFIIERVVLEIKRYLSQDHLLNYEIAEVLGFYEAANMTKFFKRYSGLSPKEFRAGLDLKI